MRGRRGLTAAPGCARRRLTVKLSGRPEALHEHRGRAISPSARGAEPPAVHGPLKRLSGRMLFEGFHGRALVKAKLPTLLRPLPERHTQSVSVKGAIISDMRRFICEQGQDL